MRDYAAMRERYMRDGIPTRLGGLAANLARVNSFSKNPVNRDVVHGLLDESKYFIEWTASEAEVSTAAELVELQVQLALWQRRWEQLWADQAQRAKIAEQSQAWSDKVLDMSGLLD
jgi:hypothetical protein